MAISCDRYGRNLVARRKLIPDEPKKSAPAEVDLREDDLEFDPAAVDAVTPSSSKAWLNLLRESEDAFADWNARCDNIDKQYANLARLADMVRDKEFQMFWSNCEVLKPSIYAKPPQPVVVPKFKDRRPVYQAASEVAERCAIVAFDLSDMDGAMKLCRDDLALIDRGVAWVRYEKGGKGKFYNHEKICVDFKPRRDFLHSISRNWREVTWVAGASYLTRGEMRKRFKKHSGDAYQTAEYKADRDAHDIGGADRRERAKVWEIWSKDDYRVYWVSEGCDVVLDESDPHLEFRNFFPCPQPAYGTVQRGSLVPVPDVLQYRDQLEELNLLTSRIHALSDALEVKGFYPAGGAELADAIQAAVQTKEPGRVLVPISNWAAFGGSKEIIVWLPIEMISQTIVALVQLRKQVIEDIYQIMGISDIMRGSTDPSETLGAQQLKTQNGSTRIRDKQQELVRMSRDMVEIFLEIICQVFDPVTIIEMSQTQLPTEEMKQQQMAQLAQRAQQLQLQMQPPAPPPGAEPGLPVPQAQPNEQLQGQMQQLAREYQKLQEQPTIDQVLYFLSDNRARAFTLDIETDSTILADEQSEKQMVNEFMGVLATVIPQLTQMIQVRPKATEFAGELLKFATKPYRAAEGGGRPAAGRRSGDGEEQATAAGRGHEAADRGGQAKAAGRARGGQDGPGRQAQDLGAQQPEGDRADEAGQGPAIRAGQGTGAEPESDDRSRGAPGAYVREAAGHRAEARGIRHDVATEAARERRTSERSAHGSADPIDEPTWWRRPSMRTAYFLGFQALLLLAILSASPASPPSPSTGAAYAAPVRVAQ
jgi:hypothetical protein